MGEYDATFDMDGVLVDTKEALQHAYAAAGAYMPAGGFGLPWTKWLVSQCDGDVTRASAVHRLKNELYPHFLKEYGRAQWGLETLVQMRKMYRVAVVTYASEDTALVTGEFLGLHAAGVEIYTTQDKYTTLKLLCPRVHVDDHHVVCPDDVTWVRYDQARPDRTLRALREALLTRV